MGTWETIETGGAKTRAWAAGDPAPGMPGVIVLHAWWGLNADALAYAERIAAEGFAVLEPDLYRGDSADTIEGAEELAGRLDETAADAIALATIDALADRLGPEAPLATIGFSLGAAWSIWSAAERDRVAGSVVYYGTVLGPSLARAHVPVLGHFAESDPFEPAEQVAAFEEALRAAGRSAEIHRYPGTGHWFAEPSRDAYRPAAADLAFERTVDFLRRVTAPAA
jgi:carboxymethylenebutenolidase